MTDWLFNWNKTVQNRLTGKIACLHFCKTLKAYLYIQFIAVEMISSGSKTQTTFSSFFPQKSYFGTVPCTILWYELKIILAYCMIYKQIHFDVWDFLLLFLQDFLLYISMSVYCFLSLSLSAHCSLRRTKMLVASSKASVISDTYQTQMNSCGLGPWAKINSTIVNFNSKQSARNSPLLRTTICILCSS